MRNASFSDDIGFLGSLARLRLKAEKYLVHGSAYRSVTVTASRAAAGSTDTAPATALPLVPICDFGDAMSTGTPKCW